MIAVACDNHYAKTIVDLKTGKAIRTIAENQRGR
jgi:hypothetical protein